MGRINQIVKHPQRAEIDRALLENRTSTVVARTWKVSRSALWRYKQRHLIPAQKRAQAEILEARRAAERKIREQLTNALVDSISPLVDQLRLAQQQVREQELLAKTDD